MRRRFAALIAASFLITGAAIAKDAQLTAREARAELRGVDLVGRVEGIDAIWRECIEPSGETVYHRPEQMGEPRVDRGRLVVTDGGQLCFTYESQGYRPQSCFWARRDGSNYRLVSVAQPSLVYATEVVRRGVRDCGPAGPGV